ncbi:MAG: ParB/RepB/Spo0J family partition protein [Wolbachia endosymbiont of Fragariocoptes setiger]|nr:ParB/RepB/Spo0J family partition protein [Wolbachia endosymbiont of Fragariocoptes setiger]
MKHYQRLGLGLSGLIAGSTSNIPDNKQEFLPVSLLHPSRFQPRKYFDEESLNELANSIEKSGMIQPIVVRKDLNEGGYEIIAGERRWRASKIIRLNNVPVIIRDLNDRECLEISIIENVQRQDINPIEEGEAYKKLIDEFSYTHEELALAIGKSRSYITNMIRMLSLPESVQKMVDEKKISMGHARALINVINAKDIADKIVSRGLNVRQTEKLIKGLSKNKNKEKKNENLDIKTIENIIALHLGFDVIIQGTDSGGKIIIKYDSLSELDSVVKILTGKENY